MGDDLYELPEGWVWVKLSYLADIKGGITKGSKHQLVNGIEIPYLRVANVQRGYLDLTDIKTIKTSKEIISKLQLKKGDILFTEGGDRDKLGRGWIWRGELSKCIHQNHIFRARLYLPEVSSKFISWFGNTYGAIYFMRVGKQTTNLASINLSKLSEFVVPLPPLPEQHRIVAKIEELFTQLDAGVELLKKLKVKLKRYRQAVLKSAVEGNLTKEWREANKSELEPASVLLERILKQRREKWEAEQLAKMKANGKTPKDNRI